MAVSQRLKESIPGIPEMANSVFEYGGNGYERVGPCAGPERAIVFRGLRRGLPELRGDNI